MGTDHRSEFVPVSCNHHLSLMIVRGVGIYRIYLIAFVLVAHGAVITGQQEIHTADVTGNKRQFLQSALRYPLHNLLSPWRFRQRVATGIDECNFQKACPKGKFCDVHECRKCLKENKACHFIGTCCEGTACKYGKCTKGAKQGESGTYCDKSSDCLGNEACCIREISVNPRTSVCKPMLDKYESCGPINLFHQIYMGGKVEPTCGPCKTGLQCKNVGIKGLHFVCLKEEDD